MNLKNGKRKAVLATKESSYKGGEIFHARRDQQEIFKIMKSRDLQPRLLYPAKLSFRIERQIKCFPHKKKLKEFIITKALLYEMLKGLS